MCIIDTAAALFVTTTRDRDYRAEEKIYVYMFRSDRGQSNFSSSRSIMKLAMLFFVVTFACVSSIRFLLILLVAKFFLSLI